VVTQRASARGRPYNFGLLTLSLCVDHFAAKLLPLRAGRAALQDALRLFPEAFSSQCSPHWSRRGASVRVKHRATENQKGETQVFSLGDPWKRIFVL